MFYCPKNLYYTWDLWNTVFVRMKMLGHWGKKTMYGTFKKKPCNRKRSRWMHRGKTWEKKYWQEHETNIWCSMWWLKAEVTFILKKLSFLKIKKATSSTLPSLCVCLLPGRRHSSLGNSWSCWGWTRTAGADFSACCALAFRFKKQPKHWTSAACHCLPLSSPLISIVHHEYLYYHAYLMLLQIIETSIHSELLEGITYFSTIFITQSRYTVDTQRCWMNKWKNRLLVVVVLVPLLLSLERRKIFVDI